MRAVITGATSGIGKAMACQLAQDGWSLVLTGRNQTVLEQLQKNLPTAVEILPLDLAEEEAPYQLFDFCKKKRVDSGGLQKPICRKKWICWLSMCELCTS